MPAMPITTTSAEIPSGILNNVIEGNFTNHLNLDTVEKFLIELLGSNKDYVNKSIVVAEALKEYIIKENPINNIFQYLIKSINSNQRNLSDALKNSLLEFCQLFLIRYEELNNPNNPDNLVCTSNPNDAGCTFFNNKLKIFNGYLDFFKHLLSIASISIVNTSGEITHENHARDFFGLIGHSSELLGKLLIENPSKSSLIDTREGITDFFSGLGHLAYNLGLNHNEEYHIVGIREGYKTYIEGVAASFYNSVKDKVNASILTDAIEKYSLNLHNGDMSRAKEHCLDLFKQACLFENASAVTMVQNSIPTSANHSSSLSTTILAPAAMRTEALAETTTLASYVPLNVTLSSHNSIRNETEIDVTLNASNYLIPPTPELIAAAGHGIVNGVSNALSQHVSERLSSPDYSGSRTTAAVLNLVSILVHSGYAAAFPLILASLENADISDDNAKDEMWERITQQVIPSFFTNLGFSLGFQVLNHYHTHYLSGFPTVKAALQSIPVVSTACAAISAPIATGVNISTAVISSFLTKTALNRFFSLPKKEASESIGAKEEAEMSLILNANNSILNTTPRSVNNANLLEGSIYFLKSKQLEIVKENLTTVITHLKNMSDVYIQGNTTIENHKQTLNTAMKEMKEKNIIISCTAAITEHEENFINNKKKLEIINTQKSKLERFNELLSDDIHSNACIGFVSAETLVKDVNVQNLWALMKTMMDQKIMEELEQALCSINGIDSKKLIICPESTEPNKQLEAHMSTIRNNSSLVTSVLQGAVRIYDAKQQGVTAAKKASASYANNTVISATLRKDKDNNGTPNRRHTVTLYSSASDDSNSSITLSTISGSSAYDPVEPQQEQPLLRPSL
jgi:hypothetical protein